MTSQIDDHSDKYSDPRARITRRGVLIGLGVAVAATAGAALSIWSRRTRLEKSTAFWGPDVILAFQLAEEVELLSTPDSDPVRLSGMPGLGHLRHVLLDERSYRWESETEGSIRDHLEQSPPKKGSVMTLQFRDPTASRFPDTRIVINLDDGWVGDESASRRVQLNERFRKAMPNYLRQIKDYEPIRSENREQDQAGG